jgi:hypothetical protein
MPAQPTLMIAQSEEQLQQLIQYVTGPEAHTRTATEVELTLFRRLLALGAVLLRLFFVTRATPRPAEPVCGLDGIGRQYHDRRPRTYYSIFGKVSFRRHAYTAPGHPVFYPLDAALSLPDRVYSDLLGEWASYGSTDSAFRETQTWLERVLGLDLSVQALETSLTEAAADVESFYEQPPAAPATPSAAPSPASVLVVQADGKGVPIVPAAPAEREARRRKGRPADSKREAIVTALYTIAPYPRTPDDLVAALLREGEPIAANRRPRPQAKEQRATLAGKTVALTRLAPRAAQRDDAGIVHRVALTDGAVSLQTLMQQYFPGYTLVLDIIHATEYLWDAATALLGERHPDRTTWVREHLRLLLGGKVVEVITRLTEAAGAPDLTTVQRRALERTCSYYQRNQAFMGYDQYLTQGWPIGTGVVEGACGHLVKDRLDQAGMRWTKPGAQAVLDLRAVRLNGDWDRYWHWHREQQHAAHYGTTIPRPAPAEALLMDEAA